jgi:hypothetical protein
LVVVVAVGCIACGDPPLCTEWIDTKLQYEIQLLSLVDALPGSPPGFVFFGDEWPEPTCGDGAPMTVGDTLYTRFTRGEDPSDINQSCASVGMGLSLEPFGLEEMAVGVRGIGSPIGGDGIVAERRVRMASGCNGGMRVALNPLAPEHRALLGDSAPSDYILVRGFAEPLVSCFAMAPVGNGAGQCWDSWFVKITDSTGRVITKHPDGGL